MKRVVNWTTKNAKKLIVAVIGTTVLIIGIIMIVAPGPAFIVIPIGLSILATEFVWARKLLDKVKHRFDKVREAQNEKHKKYQKERRTKHG